VKPNNEENDGKEQKRTAIESSGGRRNARVE
jgi:hypothetical protein